MNDDIISRSALKKVINEYIDEYSDLDNEGNHCEKWCAMKEAEMALDNAPPVEPFGPEELKGLRLENEVILRRLKHLLESDYISQFDQLDPNTKEYIRNIREADWRVIYLCDQEKPCKEDCKKYHHCKRTSDISHAKNFKLVPNGIYPVTFEEVDGAEKRPQGEWLELETNPSEFLGHRFYICSKCGREIDVMTPDESLDDYPFCHCGARMIEEIEK